MGGSAADSKQTVSVRNLRIREDTAKYLRNLDADSAYYDPKTRSMRENPYEQTGKVGNYLFRWYKFTILFRPKRTFHLLVRILFVIPVRAKSSPNHKCSHGMQWIKVLMSMLKPILHNWNI